MTLLPWLPDSTGITGEHGNTWISVLMWALGLNSALLACTLNTLIHRAISLMLKYVYYNYFSKNTVTLRCILTEISLTFILLLNSIK